MSEIGSMKLSIPLSISVNWNINESNILDSTNKITHKPLFKLAFQPSSHEFLVTARPKGHEGHLELIAEHGKYKFNEYVRGIWLKDKNIVYLRMHDKPEYLKATKEMLIEHGVPDDVRIIWGDAAEIELDGEPDLV